MMEVPPAFCNDYSWQQFELICIKNTHLSNLPKRATPCTLFCKTPGPPFPSKWRQRRNDGLF